MPNRKRETLHGFADMEELHSGSEGGCKHNYYIDSMTLAAGKKALLMSQIKTEVRMTTFHFSLDGMMECNSSLILGNWAFGISLMLQCCSDIVLKVIATHLSNRQQWPELRAAVRWQSRCCLKAILVVVA